MLNAKKIKNRRSFYCVDFLFFYCTFRIHNFAFPLPYGSFSTPCKINHRLIKTTVPRLGNCILIPWNGYYTSPWLANVGYGWLPYPL